MVQVSSSSRPLSRQGSRGLGLGSGVVSRTGFSGTRPLSSPVKSTPSVTRSLGPTSKQSYPVSQSKSNPVGDKKSNPDGYSAGTIYINDKIKAFEVIVVTEEGEALSKMSRYDALAMAKEKGLDLVQLSYNPIDKVCTAKMTDFGKYMYDKKKVTKEKKKTANKGMKQMKFAYGIGDNDLELKIKKIKQMLNDAYTVRVFVQLKGRENIYKIKVIEKLHNVRKSLEDIARCQSPEPKQDKNTYSFMFTPIKK